MIKIMNKNQMSFNKDAFYAYLTSKNPNVDLNYVDDIYSLYKEVCSVEGVDLAVALSQVLFETVNFTYRNKNKKEYHNFGGIRFDNQYQTFPSDKDGIISHVQMLKAYASKESLVMEKTGWYSHIETSGLLGTSPNVIGLSGTWVTPGFNKNKYPSLEKANEAKETYGYSILNIYNAIISTEVEAETIDPPEEVVVDVESEHAEIAEETTTTAETVEEKKDEIPPLSVTHLNIKTEPVPTKVVQEAISYVKNNTTYYKILCGVFQNPTRAENIKAKLNKKKFNATIIQDGGVYKVYSGSFGDKDKAVSHLRKILGAGIACNIETHTKL